MISISNTTYATTGNVVIYSTQSCRFGEHKARVGRHATLDGGAVIVHSGVSHGDRTLQIDARVSKDIEDDFKTIFENSTGVLVSIPDGLFYGAIADIEARSGRLKASILIKSKEND